MILGYLIFAHLLGDFVFQPESLVKLKMKNVRGVLIHVIIHFILGVIVLLPFITHGYKWLVIPVFIICFFHFLIDQAKINYDLKHDKKVRPFVIDQMLHMLTLLVTYFFISDIELKLPETSNYRIYTNTNIIIFLSLLVFLSTAIETYRYQKVRERDVHASFRPNPKKIAVRISVFTVVYTLFVVLAYYSTK